MAGGRSTMPISAENRMDRHHPTKVLLADDHTMFREGLAGLLASYGGLEVVAEVPNDARVPGLARELAPDLVLMQVQRPFARAKETLKEIGPSPPPEGRRRDHVRGPREMRELLRLGTSAYVVKSSSSGQLIGAVRAAVFDPERERCRGDAPGGPGGGGGVPGWRPALCQGAGDTAPGLPWPLQPADSVKGPPGRGHRQAPPRQHLPKDGGWLQGRGREKALQVEWITITDITDEEET